MTYQELSGSLVTLMQDQYVAIEYDKKRKVIIQTWYDYVPSEIFRFAIDKTVKFAKEKDVFGIISNALLQNVLPKEDVEYAASAIPQLKDEGVEVMAFVIPQNIFTQISLKNFEKTQNELETQYFTTYKRAFTKSKKPK